MKIVQQFHPCIQRGSVSQHLLPYALKIRSKTGHHEKNVNDFCCIFHQAEKFALSTNRGSKNSSMMNQVQNWVTWFWDLNGLAVKWWSKMIQDDSTSTEDWLVVSNMFYVHPYLGKWSNLTYIFQMGGFNHQPEDCFTQDFFVCQEVQVSSLKTLYSWVCVLKCTYTEATVHCFTLPFSSSTCCNTSFI